MSAWAILLCVASQVLIVGGQIFFKRAMAPDHPPAGESAAPPAWWKRTPVLLALGVGTQAAWFFLWVGLMEKWELTKLYPFEGLNPAMLVLLAAVTLKERLSLTAWVGLALICVGIGIVSTS